MLYEGDHLQVYFDDQFIPPLLANSLLDKLNTMHFKSQKHRSSLMFGDDDLAYRVTYKQNKDAQEFKTSYSVATPWCEFPDLLLVKQQLEAFTQETYNFCAVMKYPDGKAIIKRHRDKEMTSQICGVSLGETRAFQLTFNNQQCTLQLNHGSLYCLLPPTNTYWCHEILPSTTPHVRYSLTFRHQENPCHVNDFHFCKALLKTGKRKGQHCGAITLTNYCKRHGKK